MLYFRKAGSSRISDMTLTGTRRETKTKTNTKSKTKTKTKTKTKVLKRPNICYIYEKQGVQGLNRQWGLLKVIFFRAVVQN